MKKNRQTFKEIIEETHRNIAEQEFKESEQPESGQCICYPEKCCPCSKCNGNAQCDQFRKCSHCSRNQDKLACEKHNRILIGKDRCVDCDKDDVREIDDETVACVVLWPVN